MRLVTLFFFSLLVAFGQQNQQSTSINTEGLSARQIESLQAVAKELKSQPENTLANLTLQNATPERFEEWIAAGEAAGKAFSGFSKEVGIAGDAFIKTNVGQIAIFAIIWKVGGDAVIGSFLNVLFDAAMLIFLATAWWQMVKRFIFHERKIGEVEYNQNTLLRWLGFNKKTVKYEVSETWKEKLNPSEIFWITLLSRAGAVVSLFIIAAMCWPKVSF